LGFGKGIALVPAASAGHWNVNDESELRKPRTARSYRPSLVPSLSEIAVHDRFQAAPGVPIDDSLAHFAHGERNLHKTRSRLSLQAASLSVVNWLSPQLSPPRILGSLLIHHCGDGRDIPAPSSHK
jgi:hypothetical protein